MVGQQLLMNHSNMKSIALYLLLSLLTVACAQNNPQPEQPVNVFTVDALVPDYGAPGTEVIIKGNNFPQALSEIEVYFGDQKLDIVSGSKIELKVIAPEHKPGDVPVIIKVGDRTVKKDFYFLASKPEQYPTYPQTEAGKILKGETCIKVLDILWDTTCVVTTGLDYYQMQIKTDANEQQNIYLLRADLSQNIEMKVVLPSTTTSSSWKKQTLTVMTKNNSTTSKPVYAMINADFWNMTSPINPRGPVHCGGSVVSSEWDYDPKLSQQALSYVGITTEGMMTIGYRQDYPSAMMKMKECTGAGVVMVYDGKIQSISTAARDPRTAIGYTADNVVWMLTVDGRHGTTGMTYQEMGSIFFSLGCMAAANLDGGGSAQMLIKNPLGGAHKICNWPSDPTDGKGGTERAVINAWAVFKK